MDVALVRWPSDESLRVDLAERGHPRLLLVETEADPPLCIDTLEDWVRLPVSRADRNARISSLEKRADGFEDAVPVVNRDGILEFSGARVELSDLQMRLITPLIERFGAVVGREDLSARAWPGNDVSANNLDVTMGRLRRLVEPVGLQVRTVRSRGYLLCPQGGRS